MAKTLPSPPRFDNPDSTGQGPKSLADWTNFYRFLLSLWAKAKDSTTDQQVETFIPSSAGSPVSAIGAAQAFGDRAWGDRPDPNRAISAVLAGGVVCGPLSDNLAGFLLSSIPVDQPVARSSTTYGTVVAGLHYDRISIGTGNITASVLTWATGPQFSANWLGKAIAINGGLYVISVFTDATHITLAGGPPNGACGWEFMLYPANTLPPGSAFLETDHHVIYRNGDSSGTCNLNHSTVTWVSGPLFSPYWGGLPIFINGVTYVVSFSTQTSLTLTTDSGLVTAGLTWTVLNSSWWYETGIEAMSFATWAARAWTVLDDGYRADIYDYGHQIGLNGVSGLWAFASADSGSKYIVASANGSAPQGGPWGFCNGSSYNVFEIIAGVPQLVSVVTPNLTSDTFIRGGAFTGSADASTSPTFNPAGLTFTGTPLGNHVHDSPVGVINATTAFLTTDTGTGGTHSRDANFTISAGSGSAAVLQTSAVSAGTPAGTISGSGAVSAPTVGAGAPKSFALLFYMRQ